MTEKPISMNETSALSGSAGQGRVGRTATKLKTAADVFMYQAELLESLKREIDQALMLPQWAFSEKQCYISKIRVLIENYKKILNSSVEGVFGAIREEHIVYKTTQSKTTTPDDAPPTPK